MATIDDFSDRGARDEYVAGLGPFLKKRLRGQDAAVDVLAKAIARVEVVGVRRAKKPKASFFCAGPTGVGKTESTQLIAEYLYGTSKHWRDGGRLAAFDMAEFAEDGSIAQLLGRGKDEQGVLGDAMDALNEKGGGILLFDEIEKAHTQVAKMFLSLLDAARTTMKNGSVKSAENMYVFCTSNVGAALAAEMEMSPEATVRRTILNEATAFFAPEVMARYSEKIVFMRLSRPTQVAICGDYLPGLCERVSQRNGLRGIGFDADALASIAAESYSKSAGARFVMSVCDRVVGNAILEWLSSGTRKQENPHLMLRYNSPGKKIFVVEEMEGAVGEEEVESAEDVEE